MAGRAAESASMENPSPKIKVCVIGGGFSGILTALACKRHFGEFEVVLIDPGNEMHFSGLGLSMPGKSSALLMSLLRIPTDQRKNLMAQWISETTATVKLQFQFQNWQDDPYDGWLGNPPFMPSADFVKFPGIISDALHQTVKNPDEKQYKLFDLWYELYLSGKRTWADANADTNHYYWYCKYNTIPQDNIFDALPTLHINAWNFGEWLKKNYIHELDAVYTTDVKSVNLNHNGSINSIVLTDGINVKADFYLDCTGFKRVLGRALKAEYVKPLSLAPNNSAVVVGQGYSQNIDNEMHPYTVGYGMDFGWANCIPMKNARSYGYMFNTAWISSDQALIELEKIAPRGNRVIDPVQIHWDYGYYRNSMDKNYAMIGISSGFHDVFEAHIVGLQLGQLLKILEYIGSRDVDFTQSMTKDPYNYNDITRRSFESLAQRLDFFMCLAPKNTSAYWRHNRDLGRRHQLLDRFHDQINDPEHHESARKSKTFRPYPVNVYYNDGLHWNIDFSKRCSNSSETVLELACAYFETFNRLNEMRARMAPSMRMYYKSFGVDLATLQTLQ